MKEGTADQVEQVRDVAVSNGLKTILEVYISSFYSRILQFNK